jgi:hypothetical protein
LSTGAIAAFIPEWAEPAAASEPPPLERRSQRPGERTLYRSGHQGKKGMQGKETVGVVPLPYGEFVAQPVAAKSSFTKYTSSV